MNPKIQSVRGMNDLLPGQINCWHRVESVLREVAWRYGYEEIRTPVLEKTELFRQSIGAQTDIVEKEMYVFEDAGEVSLALRPEATASTVRAGIQHGLFHNRQQRLWYMGPMFRRERPQKGRYRQFYQFGIEAFGWRGPDVDAEVIRLAAHIWQELGLTGLTLELNSLGSVETRGRYRNQLRDYFMDHVDDLDEDSRRRLERNPLRILDSKVPRTREIVEQAPSVMECLASEERQHFDNLADSLVNSGVQPVLNHRLVRGIDYYTGTVFEWVTQALGAQSAVCAGGRYDGLVESRGGRSTPGVGFALGLERLVELMVIQNLPDHRRWPDVYVISMVDQQIAVEICETLRNARFGVIEHCGGGKLSNGIKRANSSGARFVIVVGEDEMRDDSVQLKDLRSDLGQRRIPRDNLPAFLHRLLGLA